MIRNKYFLVRKNCVRNNFSIEKKICFYIKNDLGSKKNCFCIKNYLVAKNHNSVEKYFFDRNSFFWLNKNFK